MARSDAYTPESWASACLVDTGVGPATAKSRYRLPIRKPDGTLDSKMALHVADQLELVGPAQELADIIRTELRQVPPQHLLDVASQKLTSAQRIADRENARKM